MGKLLCPGERRACRARASSRRRLLRSCRQPCSSQPNSQRRYFATIGGYAVAVWYRIEPLVKELRLRENAVLFQNYELLLPECHDCYVPGIGHQTSITASSEGGGSTTEQIERALPIKQIPTVELQLMNSGTLPIQSSAADHVEKPSAMDPVDDSLTSKTPIAPDLPLPDTDGISHRISEFTASGPAVLVYARGAHCPFCLRQLSDYADRYSDFNELA